MTLAFSTKFPNGNPTYFLEKIWQSFDKNYPYQKLEDKYLMNGKTPMWDITIWPVPHPKIHTIRVDKKDRWAVGKDIHFVINNRTKDRFQFAPVVKVKSVQTIEIEHDKDYICVLIDGNAFYERNQRFETHSEAMLQLAQNDGFDSVEYFFEWFKEDFTGKIISWHDIKY